MEKCTYCVQRINAAKIEAEKENRQVRDGGNSDHARPPALRKRSFGDINNRDSVVAKAKADSLLRPVDRIEHETTHDLSCQAEKPQPGDQIGLKMESEPFNKSADIDAAHP